MKSKMMMKIKKLKEMKEGMSEKGGMEKMKMMKEKMMKMKGKGGYSK